MSFDLVEVPKLSKVEGLIVTSRGWGDRAGEKIGNLETVLTAAFGIMLPVRRQHRTLRLLPLEIVLEIPGGYF